MDMYIELLNMRIKEITKMILDIDEVLPSNDKQGEQKHNIQQNLINARMCLREAADSVEWYIRKA